MQALTSIGTEFGMLCGEIKGGIGNKIMSLATSK